MKRMTNISMAKSSVKPLDKIYLRINLLIPNSWSVWQTSDSHRFVQPVQKEQSESSNQLINLRRRPGAGWCPNHDRWQVKANCRPWLRLHDNTHVRSLDAEWRDGSSKPAG